MNTNMNGKPISYIELDPMWTMHGHPERVDAGNGLRLSLSATHHGDHDQFWIVLHHANGEEIERFNPRGVQHIRWASESESGE